MELCCCAPVPNNTTVSNQNTTNVTNMRFITLVEFRKSCKNSFRVIGILPVNNMKRFIYHLTYFVHWILKKPL